MQQAPLLDDPEFSPEERYWLTQSRGGGALGDVPTPVARKLIEVGFVRRTPTGLAVSQKGREWLVRHGFLHRRREPRPMIRP